MNLREQQAKAWRLAPEEAKWIAQDITGAFWWYSYKPNAGPAVWGISINNSDKEERLCDFEINGWDWRDTLQTREEWEAMNTQDEFQREERYIVLKLKSMSDDEAFALNNYLADTGIVKARTECVVVESDWPIYETVWKMVEAQWRMDQISESGSEVEDDAKLDKQYEKWLPEAKRFHELLIYNPDTGVFIWKERDKKEFNYKHHWVSWNNRCAGKVAGSTIKKKHKTYVHFTVDGKKVYAHRAAWLMTTGRWPENEIDHINGDSTDNSISNLREATREENCRNMQLQRKSKSGFTGVNWHEKTGQWRGRVMFEGKEYFCGLHNDAEEAAKAVKEKRRELGFHDNHGSVNQTQADKERDEQIELMAKHLCPGNQGSWMYYMKDAEFLIDSGWVKLKPGQKICTPLTKDEKKLLMMDYRDKFWTSSNLIDAVQSKLGLIEEK